MEKQNNTGHGSIQIRYYTDPLCVWSWVFEPAWQELQTVLGDQLGTVQYVMGGMLADWKTYNDTLNAVTKPIQMGPVWLQAKQSGGAGIDDRIWFTDPPASSYPACVAVKAAGLQSPQAARLFLYNARKAVITARKNIARREVLLEVATALEQAHPGIFNAATFEKDLVSDAAVQAFRDDLQEIRYRGITRFPTLMITRPGLAECLVLTGNRPCHFMLDAINRLLEKPVTPQNGESLRKYEVTDSRP